MRLKERGLISKSASALRTKRKRNFKGHAMPWTFKDYKKMVMGERVQIDHMTVTKNGICFKQFHSWDRKSKFIDSQIYSNAKSASAKRFLKPTYNGGVERGNRTFREEFYNRSNLLADSIGAMRVELKKATEKYNTYRPHRALKGLTPMQYINDSILQPA